MKLSRDPFDTTNIIMRRVALFLMLAGVLVNGQESRWENAYDEPLNFVCPPDQTISHIKSQHHNDHEDRMWEFGCQHTFDAGADCFWSPDANDFDQPLTFECPPQHVMAGMSSYHDNDHEDRRWKFYCCRGTGHCNANCQWSTYVNWFDEAFDWYVPSYHFLVGVDSYHENEHEDRRWRYMYCTKQAC